MEDDASAEGSRRSSSRRSSIEEALGLKRRSEQPNKVNFALPTVVESPIKDLPMEVPSTMNRRGTVTAVDIAIPNVGGEDNGDPHKFSKRRVCEKNGAVRIKYKNVSQRRRKFIKDIYTTLVDSSWSMSLFLFSMSFYVTWVGYAIAYWIIMYIHGDFEHCDIENDCEDGWTPCILAVYDFSSAFLFSLETQHTIGYGSRQSTTECVDLMIICSTQSVIGCLIQTFMVGLVFAKLSNPKKRTKTIVFSKKAVIFQRNKKLCLGFRCGDMRPKSFIVGAALGAKIIRRKETKEGEMYHDAEVLTIEPDSCNEANLFLVWPFTVIHVIDKHSPFYRWSQSDLKKEAFELHVSLEGTIETTSMNFQARSSYLPNEITWGHRFEPIISFDQERNKYQVNFAALNSTYEVDTPCCSAKELDDYYKAWSAYRKASKASADSGTPLTLEKPVLPGSNEKEEDPERKKSSASGRMASMAKVNMALTNDRGEEDIKNINGDHDSCASSSSSSSSDSEDDSDN